MLRCLSLARYYTVRARAGISNNYCFFWRALFGVYKRQCPIQMALQPPSYFQAPSASSKQQPKNEKKLPAAQQEPLTSHHVLPTSPSLPSSGLQLADQQAAAMLTNDLLAVETHLQSRVRLLEEEKKNLINRIVELEKSLVQQKEERRAQMETLTTQHNQTLLQVRERERERVYE